MDTLFMYETAKAEASKMGGSEAIVFWKGDREAQWWEETGVGMALERI